MTRLGVWTAALAAVLMAGIAVTAPAHAASKVDGDVRTRYFVTATVDADARWNSYLAGDCSTTGAGAEKIATTPPANGITIAKTVWEFRSYVPKGGKIRIWSITQVRPKPAPIAEGDLVVPLDQTATTILPAVTTDVTVTQTDALNGPCLGDSAVNCSTTLNEELRLEVMNDTAEAILAGGGENGTAVSVGAPLPLKLRAIGSQAEGCHSAAECPYLSACSIDGTPDLGNEEEIVSLSQVLPWSKKILRKFSPKAVAAGRADFKQTMNHNYSLDLLGTGLSQGHYNVTLTFDRLP